MLEQRHHDAEIGEEPAAAKAKSVAEAIKPFMDSKRGEDLVGNTLYKHRLTLNRLQDYGGRQGVFFVKDITRSHVTSWRAYAGAWHLFFVDEVCLGSSQFQSLAQKCGEWLNLFSERRSADQHSRHGGALQLYLPIVAGHMHRNEGYPVLGKFRPRSCVAVQSPFWSS